MLAIVLAEPTSTNMRPPINPNLFQFDDSAWANTDAMSGLGLGFAGQEQIRQRRAGLADDWWNTRGSSMGFGPMSSPFAGAAPGVLPSASWDAYFGALQGKENAVGSQGGDLNVNFRRWGRPGNGPVQGLQRTRYRSQR
jgi:hypothetical protein